VSSALGPAQPSHPRGGDAGSVDSGNGDIRRTPVNAGQRPSVQYREVTRGKLKGCVSKHPDRKRLAGGWRKRLIDCSVEAGVDRELRGAGDTNVRG